MSNKANDIVEKATTAFMLNGLQSVSMNDIASYSGVSKRTLYEYFQGKEMLIATIVQKIITKTSKYIRLCPDISPNAMKEIQNFSAHILNMLEDLTPKFIRDLKKYYPVIYAQLIVFRDNSIIPYLERCLARGIKEEIFRGDIDKRNTSWLYCWQIQNALEGVTSYADVNMIVENVNDLFLHSILNSKGLKLLSMNKLNEHMRQSGQPGSRPE